MVVVQALLVVESLPNARNQVVRVNFLCFGASGTALDWISHLHNRNSETPPLNLNEALVPEEGAVLVSQMILPS